MSALTTTLTGEQLANAFDELGIINIVRRQSIARENRGELYLVTIIKGPHLWESDSVAVVYESEESYGECFDKLIKKMDDIRPSWVKLAEQMYADTTPICYGKCKIVPSLKLNWWTRREDGLGLEPEVLVRCEDDPNKMCVNLTYSHHRMLVRVSYKIPADDFERRYQIYDDLYQNIESFNGVLDEDCGFIDHQNLGENFNYVFDRLKFQHIHDVKLSVTESDDTDVVNLKCSFNVHERGRVTRSPTYETICEKDLSFSQKVEPLLAHITQYIKDNYQPSWQRMFA